MGACCASGGREGAFDQKEDKLASADLKKDETVTEKAGKPTAPTKPQENQDDITFNSTARGMKSHNEDTNVSSLGLILSKCTRSSASSNTAPLRTMESPGY